MLKIGGSRGLGGGDEGAADAECNGAGFVEVADVVEVDTAGGHEADMGKGTAEVSEIGGADGGGEDFDDVGAMAMGGEYLSGGEGAGDADGAEVESLADDPGIEGGGKDKARSGVNGSFRFVRREDGAGADEQAVAEFFANLLYGVKGAGGVERDLQ